MLLANSEYTKLALWPWPHWRPANFYKAFWATLCPLPAPAPLHNLNAWISQELALSPLFLFPSLLELNTFIPTTSVQFLRMWCPHLCYESTPVLRHSNPNTATYSASLLEWFRLIMAALWLLFLFSPSISFLSICRAAYPELNINPSVWWGKLQQFGCLVSESFLGKQHQVPLDTGPAVLTAGPCWMRGLWSAPCPWSSGLCFFVILSHLKDWSQSFTSSLGLVTQLIPSFCFADCLAYTIVLCHWPQQAISCHHVLTCCYSRVSDTFRVLCFLCCLRAWRDFSPSLMKMAQIDRTL